MVESPAKAPAAAGQPERVEALPRRLGMWNLTAITIGVVIGSGIFRTPSSIAQLAGSVSGAGLVWALGGVITLCLALSLSELATLFPRAGGIYVYLREAYGPVVAFVFGWTFLIINPAQWAAITVIFAEYAGSFVHLTGTERRIIASLLIVMVSAANYFSLRFAAAIQNVTTAAKAIALVSVALLLFTLGHRSAGALVEPIQWGTLPGWGALGVAIVAVLWPYEGVASACALSGEVRDPARAIPRALILSVACVTCLYVFINAAYLYVLPFKAVGSSELVAADATRQVAGLAGAAIISACVLLSTFGAIAATAIVDPRVFYAMARDGLFFERIGAIHPKYQTPHVAIVISAALAIVYLWVRTFEELAEQFILGLWLFYGLSVLAVFVLRRRLPNVTRPYRTLGYPIVPLIFVLSSAGLLTAAFIELPGISLVNLGVTLAGIPVYFVWKRLARTPASSPGRIGSSTKSYS